MTSSPARGLPQGFKLLIATQFCSALADNALLIVTIALLVEHQLPGWWAPLLKFGFTLSYVVLAPFVGPLADAVPKARLMTWMNAVKAAGALALLLSMNPVLAFIVVGFGAAAYAPCKYGLITELVEPERLVAANGWLEVSVVCAALLGTVLGGALVSPWWLGSEAVGQATQLLACAGVPQLSALDGSLCVLLLIYGLAGLFNLGVPESGARYPASHIHPVRLLREFGRDHLRLWRDPDGGLSLAVTTIFWGLGATLQFAVLRWAADVLHLSLDRAAYLQAAVAVGVILGATVAGRHVPLSRAKQMLPAGVALGLLMALVARVDSLALAIPLLMVVGAVGGLLVVPLNALLQHRGHQLLSAGRSIAVQGCSENASILAMLAGYAGLVALEMPIVPLMGAFGFVIAGAMAALMRRARRGPVVTVAASGQG
jgi:LPLT family lysophospholipid transporter-like MFS transporter